MKIMLLVLLMAVSVNIFANESTEQSISREIKSCLNSQSKAQDIYEKIKDKNLEDKSELETIKSYQYALSNIEVNCKNIYI